MKRSSIVLTLVMFVFIPLSAGASSFDPSDESGTIEQAVSIEEEARSYAQEDLLSTAPYYDKIEIDPTFKDDYKGRIYDYDREKKEEKPKERIEKKKSLITLSAGAIKALMYILLAVIILAVVYAIIRNSGGFHFGSKRKNISVKAGVGSAEEDSEDIDNNNFQGLIKRAKAEKDYRKAVRYYYLWVLQKLSDKQLIKWDKDKTDFDYYVELAEHPIRKDFSGNAYIFDHIWYGKFEIDEKEFKLAETLFNRTLSKLQ